MKSLKLSAILIVFLSFALATNAFACYCSERPTEFWEVISSQTKNAFVKFEKIQSVNSGTGEVEGKFIILENFNYPNVRVNDAIIIKSGRSSCDFIIDNLKVGDTLMVALSEDNRFHAACTSNFILLFPSSFNLTMDQIRAKVLLLTNSSEDLAERENIFTYPNPAFTYLTVKTPDAVKRQCKIEILDMNGRTIFSLETTKPEEDIDIRSLPKGLYFLKLTYNQSKPKMQKWVKT